MRKTIMFLAIFLLLAGMVAAECKDTDGGENYAEKGETKILSGKEDICVISPSAEVRQDTSPYLKEYYCDKDDQIKSKIIECEREGFTVCEYGECVGGTAGAKAADSNYTAPPPEPTCGDSIVDEGEDCDPVNKMCADDDGNIGLCDENCKCEIKIMRDGSKAASNDTDTTDVVIDTPTETDTAPEPVVVKQDKPEEDKEITVTIAEKPKDEAKPKGFFSKIWAWIAGLFS